MDSGESEQQGVARAPFGNHNRGLQAKAPRPPDRGQTPSRLRSNESKSEELDEVTQTALQAVRNAIFFLEPRQRRAWLSLVPLSVSAAAMEAIGAAAVFSLIQLINEPAEADTIPMVSALQGVVIGWVKSSSRTCSQLTRDLSSRMATHPLAPT